MTLHACQNSNFEKEHVEIAFNCRITSLHQAFGYCEILVLVLDILADNLISLRRHGLKCIARCLDRRLGHLLCSIVHQTASAT